MRTIKTNALSRIHVTSWAGLLVVALAFVVRLVNLDGRPLWYDESFAVLYAEKSFPAMWYGTITQVAGVAADVHPLFFYSTLHAWMLAVGQSPQAVRLLSVILGTATVFVAYLLARRLFDERIGLVTAVFVALAPFHVYYSQEVRMYALLGLTSITMVLFFVRAWSGGGKGNWVAFGLLGALTLYSHNLGAMFLASLDLWVIWRWLWRQRWHYWRPWLLSHLLMLALFSPWLLILPRQLGKVQQAYWVTRPGVVELIQTVLVFHFAYDNQALPPWLLPVAFFFSLLIPAMLVLELRRRSRTELPPAGFSAPVSLLLFLSLVPIVLTFLVSQVQPVYIVRALLPSALTYYVLLAAGLFSGLTPRPVKWGLLGPTAVVVLLSLFNHYTYAQFPRSPFDEAAVYLRQQADGAAGVIVHGNKLSFFPTHYYDRDLPQAFIADEPGSASDTLAYPTQEALGLLATPDLETAVTGHERVWFVIFERALDEYRQVERQHPQLAWLEQRYQRVDEVSFNDLNVYTYQRP